MQYLQVFIFKKRFTDFFGFYSKSTKSQILVPKTAIFSAPLNANFTLIHLFFHVFRRTEIKILANTFEVVLYESLNISLVRVGKL